MFRGFFPGRYWLVFREAVWWGYITLLAGINLGVSKMY